MQAQPPSHSVTPTGRKRSLSQSHSNAGAKRTRTEPQARIDSFFPRPTTSQGRGISPPTNATLSPEASPIPITLMIKDNKTRKNEYLPSDPDAYAGRMQLMVYRKLLSELVATNPPYDFKPLWTKLRLDSSAIFPTKFLVQAQLIQYATPEFETTCLDDLVHSWHRLVRQSNIQGVDPRLELIYRLRPPPDAKQKGKAVEINQPLEFTNNSEDENLARAIAASLEETSADSSTSVPKDLQSRSPATNQNTECAGIDLDLVSPEQPAVLVSGVEDVQLQWALQQSISPQAPASGPSDIAGEYYFKTAFGIRTNSQIGPSTINHRQNDKKGKGRATDFGQEEAEGIRRYRIIGTKKFLYDETQLESHLTHVLQWWRGERKPEGVSLDNAFRCS